MKKILLIVAIASFTSCKKDDIWLKTTPYDKMLTKPIEVILYLTQSTPNYDFKTDTYSNYGDYWETDVSLASPSKTDTGTYKIQQLNESYDSTLGTAEFRVVRYPAIKDNATDFHGTGKWYLLKSTGVYSFLKLAKGDLTYKETHTQSDDSIDYLYLEYDLKGMSN